MLRLERMNGLLQISEITWPLNVVSCCAVAVGEVV